MCLIVQRDPKIELPFEDFKTAVLNNPDGWGLSYPSEDGKLITLRNPEKPDVDKLYRLVNEELIDKQLLLHLRYTTAGETILRNAHPFPVLERGADGIDLRMAHNGTISKWLDHRSDESDTRRFVRGYVRPLFKRLIRGADIEELLTDPFLAAILEDQLPGSSVLSFLDGKGNTLNINALGNGGTEKDGVYYSNTYSFDPEHRSPSYGWPSYGYNSSPTSASSNKTKAEKKKEEDKKKSLLEHPGHADDSNQPRFTDVFELDDIEILYDLDDAAIQDLITRCPDEAYMMVIELLEDHQKLSRELKKVEGQLAELKYEKETNVV